MVTVSHTDFEVKPGSDHAKFWDHCETVYAETCIFFGFQLNIFFGFQVNMGDFKIVSRDMIHGGFHTHTTNVV